MASRYTELYSPIVALILIILAWQEVVTYFHVPTYALPSPYLITLAIVSPKINWVQAIWSTLAETIGGFVLSIVFGMPVAILSVYSTWFRRTVYPLIVAIQVVPKVGLAPILFIVMGFGFVPRAVITFLVAFFPVIINTADGLNALDLDSVYLMRSLGASQFQLFSMARLPNALPQIFTGLKVAITLALVGAVVAEFVQANSGLGYELLNALFVLNTIQAFAALVILSILGGLLFLVFVVLERYSISWYRKSKEQ